MLASATARAAGDLAIGNYSPSVNGDSVDLVQNASNVLYSPPTATNASLEIFFQDPVSTLQYRTVGVSTTGRTNVPLQLRYHGAIPNGTGNSLYFIVFSDFPSDTLMTAKVISGTYSNAVDIRTVIPQGGAGGFWSLPNITGAQAGQVYGTATVYFAQLTPAQVTGINSSPSGTVMISSRLQLATWNTLYCLTNSLSDGWTNAFPVGYHYATPSVGTVDAGWTNVIFTVPVSTSKAFYRIASDPYNWP